VFKVGDLVILDASFHQDRHPPVGTYGFVTSVEDWDLDGFANFADSNSDSDVERHCKQLVQVNWAHQRNDDVQAYMDYCLKMAACAEV
jgi:hypothetical protein